MRHSLRTTSVSLSLAALACGLLAGLPPSVADPGAGTADVRTEARPDPRGASAVPRLRVRTVVRGLEHAWDVQQAPGGRLVVSERDRARLSVVRKGKRRTLADLSRRVWVSGETGLMSIAVDPARRTLWACHGASPRRSNEVRVTRWKVDRRWRSLSRPRVVLGGLPATSGRHGGCRLLLDRGSAALYVGTGDAAVGANPRDLDSLGGKVLRVHRRTGAAMPGNPFADAGSARRFVWTYGHRNVQGLAQRADGSVWSVEHGSFRDDEVNRLVAGGDYGWNPVPGYDESVPMTDQSLPGEQQEAAWSSGSPTLATSGAAWVSGPQWGRLDGTLAVAALKASEVLFLRFDANGELRSVTRPRRLARLGRLRSVTSARDGDLLLTTDNGGRDRVLRVSPR
ncbi:PQQ-dependent sugar dehydrogenase [Nocardioides ganghwensis]|uniref:PQQ-dependent sugar dehydrogenase n=1 Tax=Nocardioides ganghwensis TaxID=252230 RepID=A0A4Q2S622_9ACTN|nr:PQQ-dependent sugar dehydrogenase [Nocardioides ganghwensis]MBD3947899.1 PQQ-dependent sugar dehydrogenase [Nocardioides ganghwensis]RYB97680.1 PQQ-dependent sugar dehydrogenase [Nocardioides ganghwensis]